MITRGPSTIDEDVQSPLLRDVLEDGLPHRGPADVS